MGGNSGKPIAISPKSAPQGASFVWCSVPRVERNKKPATAGSVRAGHRTSTPARKEASLFTSCHFYPNSCRNTAVFLHEFPTPVRDCMAPQSDVRGRTSEWNGNGNGVNAENGLKGDSLNGERLNRDNLFFQKSVTSSGNDSDHLRKVYQKGIKPIRKAQKSASFSVS